LNPKYNIYKDTKRLFIRDEELLAVNDVIKGNLNAISAEEKRETIR
jgi:hypothetical protein